MPRVEPAERIVDFSDRDFRYKPTALEAIARAYVCELGASPETGFYFGREGVQENVGIFRTIDAAMGNVIISYQKSFPWGSFSALPDIHGCASSSEDAKYVARILESYGHAPEETLARLKDTFIHGPTYELLAQRAEKGEGRHFDTVVKRIVTKPLVENGLQFFSYHIDVPSLDAREYCDYVRSHKHPYARAILQQLGNMKKGAPQPNKWHMVQDSMHSLDDALEFLRLNRQFCRR